MNKQKNEKRLDELISRTINTEKPQFDAEKWKQKYPEEFQLLKSRAGQVSSAHRVNIWRRAIQSRITKLAAAAVIIICASLYLVMILAQPDNKQSGDAAANPKITTITKIIRPSAESGTSSKVSKLAPDKQVGQGKSATSKGTAMLGPVLPPPGPNEVQLDKTLLGHKRNLRVPEDGWIQIGKGIFWYYTGGTYLSFTQEDVRIYVTADDEPRQLAGLLLSDPSEIVLLHNALKELSEPTILWCKCPLPPEFITLPNLEKIIYLQRAASIGGTYNEGMNTFLNKRASVLVKFSDLSPLSNLTGLTSLDLRGCNQITDLSPLSNLINLSSLNLAGCDKISDIYPLAHLTNLTWLDLSAWDLDSPLSDLSPLSALTQLKSLNLRLRQNVSDLTPLAELAELESLDLMGCSRQISDLSPLAHLTKLKSLKLGSVWNVTDLSPLAELSNLEFLRLGPVNRSITNTSSIANLPRLKHLDLDQWQTVIDISSLASLTSLTSLRLKAFRKLSNISPLAQLTNLESLDLESCEQISDLSPLENLTKLKSLDLCACKNVSDLSPLANLTKLRDVSLQFCPKVTDLSSLWESIGQGANIQVQTASGTTNAPLTKQLSEIRSQILAERIAESSAIVQAKILETTDTEVDQKLIRSDWKVEIISNLYGEVPGKIINVVIHEPDPKISENSFGREMILFLRDENETGSYALIHARMRSPEHDEEILQVIESGTDLSVDPPN